VPIGKGQRCLIVSPPRAGKTVLLQNIANAITTQPPRTPSTHRAAHRRAARGGHRHAALGAGEVISSTFDEPATRHVQVAEMVIEKAKRLVEHKRDVVILLDSITRLARAYNTVVPPSRARSSRAASTPTRCTSPSASSAPRATSRRAARSPSSPRPWSTPGSRMDEVIFEEFKGTGNSEIHLDRKLMEKRIFP
jgi:transcription termination factor Rho